MKIKRDQWSRESFAAWQAIANNWITRAGHPSGARCADLHQLRWGWREFFNGVRLLWSASLWGAGHMFNSLCSTRTRNLHIVQCRVFRNTERPQISQGYSWPLLDCYLPYFRAFSKRPSAPPAPASNPLGGFAGPPTLSFVSGLPG